MTAFQAVVLGIIQGIGEFLPISSSGHLIFLPKFFGWGDQGLAFDMVLHLGTLLAVVVYFWKKIITWDKKLVGLVLLSTVPAAVIGFFLSDMVETKFRSPQVIGISLIVWGIVLGAADKYGDYVKKQQKNTEKLSLARVIVMAFAQIIALIPGTSRSGITMTAGLFSGLSKKTAAEFSFLMSIPIIGLAVGVKLLDVVKTGTGSIAPGMMGIGFLSSAVFGFLSIAFLMKIIQKWSFLPFVFYRIIIGVLILIFL